MNHSDDPHMTLTKRGETISFTVETHADFVKIDMAFTDGTPPHTAQYTYGALNMNKTQHEYEQYLLANGWIKKEI